MTLILGIEDPAGALLAADSSMGQDNFTTTRTPDQPKVFRRGEYVVAVCGSCRMFDIARWIVPFPPPPAKPSRAVYRHLVTVIIPGLRKAMDDAGALKPDKELNGGMLLGIGPHVYEIDSGFSVSRDGCGYITGGSGGMPALGALHATRGQPARERAVAALRAATDQTAFVRRPYRFVRARVR